MQLRRAAYRTGELYTKTVNPPPPTDLAAGLQRTIAAMEAHGSAEPKGYLDIEIGKNLPPSWMEWLEAAKKAVSKDSGHDEESAAAAKRKRAALRVARMKMEDTARAKEAEAKARGGGDAAAGAKQTMPPPPVPGPPGSSPVSPLSPEGEGGRSGARKWEALRDIAFSDGGGGKRRRAPSQGA